MKPFPVDDVNLSMLDEALNAKVAFDEEGQPYLEGGEFTLSNLLDFLSGPSDYLDVDEHLTERLEPRYSEADVIRALIDEVRRLREELATSRLRGQAQGHPHVDNVAIC